MHDLQTIIKINNQPLNQRTPPAVAQEQAIRAAAQLDLPLGIPMADQVEYR